MQTGKKEFEKLNERKKHYQVVDDDTIQSLIRYYKIECGSREQRDDMLRFVKDVGIKGDTLA
ncbi:hypothetical protein [Nitrososphaera sp.]|uniref:hypothetical protein n=1 Tax=Nitrososphaera sp. TaxID=1971748 RepID=UPI00307E1CD0